MLYPSLNQPLLLLIFLAVGILCGIIFDGGRILALVAGGKITYHILDFVSTILSAYILFKVNLEANLGQFRVYILAVFFLSFALERFISKKVWTKLSEKWYTIFGKKKLHGNEKKEKVDKP